MDRHRGVHVGRDCSRFRTDDSRPGHASPAAGCRRPAVPTPCGTRRPAPARASPGCSPRQGRRDCRAAAGRHRPAGGCGTGRCPIPGARSTTGVRSRATRFMSKPHDAAGWPAIRVGLRRHLQAARRDDALPERQDRMRRRLRHEAAALAVNRADHRLGIVADVAQRVVDHVQAFDHLRRPIPAACGAGSRAAGTRACPARARWHSPAPARRTR